MKSGKLSVLVTTHVESDVAETKTAETYSIEFIIFNALSCDIVIQAVASASASPQFGAMTVALSVDV